MESILQNGENPNKGNKNGAMPVHEVAMNESDVAPQIVEILMERGGPGGLPNSADTTHKQDPLYPVHLAAENTLKSAPKIMEIRLEPYKDSNILIGPGTTPLHLTARNTSDDVALKMVKSLLNKGADAPLQLPDAPLQLPGLLTVDSSSLRVIQHVRYFSSFNSEISSR